MTQKSTFIGKFLFLKSKNNQQISVGRACRGESTKKGQAILFLRPQELGFLQYLKKSKVPLSELVIEASKVANIQSQLEKLLSKNYYLNQVCSIYFKRKYKR